MYCKDTGEVLKQTHIQTRHAMPIIAIDLDDDRTELLDSLADEQKRSRRNMLLCIVENVLDELAEQQDANP